MNLYLLITALAIFGGFLKVAQIVLSGKPEHSEADSANSPDVKGPMSAIQLGVPESFGGDELRDHSSDIYSMSAGTIGLEGSAWRD